METGSNIKKEYILYHNLICPFSRKIRFLLDERDIEYKKIEIKIWERDEKILRLNAANETPVLTCPKEGLVIVDSYIIAEYLNDFENNLKNDEFNYFNLLGDTLEEKIEIQRLHMWFDKKFYNEITAYIIQEVFYKTFKIKKNVNSDKLAVARYNLDANIEYMEYLLTTRKWLAIEKFSLADLAAAAQISILDYLGYINWDKYLKLKNWYLVVKSKKGFRNILKDKIAGFLPSKYYRELDF